MSVDITLIRIFLRKQPSHQSFVSNKGSNDQRSEAHSFVTVPLRNLLQQPHREGSIKFGVIWLECYKTDIRNFKKRKDGTFFNGKRFNVRIKSWQRRFCRCMQRHCKLEVGVMGSPYILCPPSSMKVLYSPSLHSGVSMVIIEVVASTIVAGCYNEVDMRINHKGNHTASRFFLSLKIT